MTRAGREYANINGRLYTEHAIEHIAPRALGNAAGGTVGRGIPSNAVEEVISYGRISGIRVVGSNLRVAKMLGDVMVILEDSIVVTVIRL